MAKMAPVHPGEVLLEEFMQPLGLTANRLALDLHVPSNRILAIIKGQRAITADTALRLGRYFGTTPELWMNLQAQFDLDVAEDQFGESIRAEVRERVPA